MAGPPDPGESSVTTGTSGTEGRVVAHSPFVDGMALLTIPGKNIEMLVLMFVGIFYLLRFVCASAHIHTLQCECGGQRTTLWDWFPLSDFVGIPGSKLRSPCLHEPVPSLAEPS